MCLSLSLSLCLCLCVCVSVCVRVFDDTQQRDEIVAKKVMEVTAEFAEENAALIQRVARLEAANTVAQMRVAQLTQDACNTSVADSVVTEPDSEPEVDRRQAPTKSRRRLRRRSTSATILDDAAYMDPADDSDSSDGLSPRRRSSSGEDNGDSDDSDGVGRDHDDHDDSSSDDCDGADKKSALYGRRRSSMKGTSMVTAALTNQRALMQLEFEDTTAKLQQEIEELKAHLAASKTANAHLQRERQQAQEQLRTAMERFEQRADTKDEASARVQTLSAALARAEATATVTLEAHAAQAARLREEAEKAATAVDVQRRRARKAEEQARSLAALLREAKLSFEERQQALEADVAAKAGVIERMALSNKQLIKQVDGADALFDGERQELKQRVHDLTIEVKQRCAAEEAAAATLSAAQKEVSALKKTIAEQEDELRRLGAQAGRVVSRVASLNAERKQLFNEVMDIKGNIRVFARIRPQSARERRLRDAVCVLEPVKNKVMVTNPTSLGGATRQYRFDKVFPATSSQAKVWEDVKPLMASLMDGFNVCVFAYGQTGSGKTYTMQGEPADPGINVRAIHEVFRLRQERCDTHKYDVTVSMFEIYNETVRDLLVVDSDTASGAGTTTAAAAAPSTSTSTSTSSARDRMLDIRRGPSGPYIEGLAEVQLKTAEDLAPIASKGEHDAFAMCVRRACV